jgi:transposase
MITLRNRLEKDLKAIEKSFKNKELEEEKRLIVREVFKLIKKHESAFDITYEKETFTFRKNDNLINEALKYKGYVAIITNDFSKSTNEIINIYREKDVVEKKFDDIKNALDCDRLGVHSIEVLDGKMFVIFLATIIINQIRTVIKKHQILDKYSPERLLKEVSKLKVVNYQSGTKKINVITAKQKEIFSAFGLSDSKIKKEAI